MNAVTPRRTLGLGEAPPLLHVAANRNPRFAFGSMGGRYVLLCVVQDFAHPAAPAALTAIHAARFDERERLCALFVAGQPGAAASAVEQIARTKLVFTGPADARAMHLVDDAASDGGRWILLDPSLRVLAVWPLEQTEAAISQVASLPQPSAHAGVALHAPVLIAPRIFEANFCETLIAYCARTGAQPSGVTREDANGKTIVERDDAFKRRDDCLIADASLRDAAMHRVFWRLLPEIEKAFMWRATRMERYLVARYDSNAGGYFKAHRDNTTKGTEHRRFAVSINLNTGAYEGGSLRFPEFGDRTYYAPLGGAVVFSCALLHEALPVTSGARYAFLPFLYDENAAKVRAANNPHLAEDLPQYRAD
jgi:hypothetical protein